MARVVLHIGTHKTATTTIQDTFAHNAKLLEEHGIIYPKLGKATGHHGLVAEWNRHLPKVYHLAGGSLANLAKIAERHAHGDRTVLLSSEEFSRAADYGRVDFAALRAALAGFDRIEVLCVLREQWQFVQSIYLEIAKGRAPARPPVFVESVLGTDMVEGLWTDYNLLYDHLLQSFDPDEITFLDFDASRGAAGGIVGQVLAHLGCPLAVEALEPVNEGHSNRSSPAIPVWAASVISEPQVAPPWLIGATTGAFGVQFGEKARAILWTREETRWLRDYAQERNHRLSGRLATRQPGFAIAATPSQANDIHRGDCAADFWLRCSRWMFAHMPRADRG